MIMKKKYFVFAAFLILSGLFGFLKAESGDKDTLGFNTPSGYSYWRVDSSGYFKPGVTATLDIGTSALAVRNIYAGGLIGATITSPTITGPTISGTATFSGQMVPVQYSSTSLVALVPVSTGAVVYSQTDGVMCFSSGTVVGAWVFISTPSVACWGN